MKDERSENSKSFISSPPFAPLQLCASALSAPIPRHPGEERVFESGFPGKRLSQSIFTLPPPGKRLSKRFQNYRLQGNHHGKTVFKARPPSKRPRQSFPWDYKPHLHVSTDGISNKIAGQTPLDFLIFTTTASIAGTFGARCVEKKVLREIASLNKMPGEPGQIIEREQGYFANHAQRMNYQDIAQKGWLIGSGAVKSACRQKQCRFKRPGQFWTQTGLRNLCFLDEARRNNHWNDLWN